MMIYKKIATTFVAKAIAAICNLLILYVTVRFLGAEVRGNISLFVLNLSFVMLFSEWIAGPVLVYYFANYNIKHILKVSYLWIVITLIILLIFQLIYPISPSFLIFLFICFLQCAISLHNQLLIAVGKISEQNLIQIIQPLFIIAVLFIHIYLSKFGIETYLHSFLISSVITYLFQLFFFFKIENKYPDKLVNFTTIIKSGAYITATNIAQLITNRISYYYISSLVGLASLGIYSTGISLSEAILMASSSAGLVHYSNVANTDDKNVKIEQTKRFSLYSILITLALFIIVYFIPNSLFTLTFGKDFTDVKHFIMLYSPGILALSVTHILSHYFSGIGNFRIPFISGITSCIILGTFAKTVLLNYGQDGLLILTSATLIIQVLILYFYFIRNVRNQN